MERSAASAPAQWTFFFGGGESQADPEDLQRLGGKGASLASMSRAGLPVPPGFTISAECCRYVLENGGSWPPGLEDQIARQLARLESETGRTFGRGARPLFVAVRSGAAVSMPGMMDTLLNCGIHPGLADETGDTPGFWRVCLQFVSQFAETAYGLDPEAFATEGAPPSRALAECQLRRFEQRTGRPLPADPWEILKACIDAVFRSWHSERAIAYRKRHDIRGLWGTAVNVQAMFPSTVSGVLFTRDPNDLTAERMTIEASYGLGETVVSGEVTPDRFVVRRDDLSSFETTIGRKHARIAALGDVSPNDSDAASLNRAQIAALCELGLKLERLYGKPMDLEWGLSDGHFSLLQCRPIRGLEIAQDAEVGRLEEIERLKKLAASGRKVWVTHNLGETLRAPTPLTWDIVRRFMSGEGGFGRMYRDLGYRPTEDVRKEGFLELICGRIYADPERMARLFWSNLPMVYDLDEIAKDKNLLDAAPSVFAAEKAGPAFFLKLPGILRDLFRSARRTRTARFRAAERFQKEVLPDYLEYVRAERARDLTVLSTARVLEILHDRMRRVLDEFGKESLKPGFFGSLALEQLEKTLTLVLGHEQAAERVCTLTMGLDDDITAEQNRKLYRVAKGQETLEAFLEEFGHRAIGEMELAEPRWREDPSYLEGLLRALRGGHSRLPGQLHGANARIREAAERALPGLLAEWGGSSLREEIQTYLRETQALLPYRELGKYYLMLGYELLRACLTELGRRWDLGRDVFFLKLEELERFEDGREALLSLVARRKIRWQSAQRLDLPDVIDSERLGELGKPRTFVAAEELEGEAIASGLARGPARIVFDPREAGDLGVDYVLVCPSTDPAWTTLFLNARGLVVERGGVLSHGAIVARDFGIPAVACPDATRRLRAGAVLQVDGNRGCVSILSDGEQRKGDRGA